MRHVKGILFADYVRMMRRHRGYDWTPLLKPEDRPFLSQLIQPNDWYRWPPSSGSATRS